MRDHFRNFTIVHAPLKAPLFHWARNFTLIALTGSRNGLEREFTIELKQIKGPMQNRLNCQISPLVKYRQNKTKTNLNTYFGM